MTERLMTREQWEVVRVIEEMTMDYACDLRRSLEFSKQVIAPHFAGREFRVCWYPMFFHRSLYGPPEYRFVVYDAECFLIVGSALDLVAALRDARVAINLIGREQVNTLLDAQREVEEEKAAAEARAAIATAKKPRKVGKRAKAVFEASEGKCHYCGAALTLDGRWHIEHKFPRALFGGSEQENLVAACAPCNHAKRDKTDLEFKALLASKA